MSATAPSSIGIYEAKTHFSSVIERVLEGEIITLTKHGRPVATISPVGDRVRSEEQVAQMMADLAAVRAAWGVSGLDDLHIRALIGRDEH